VSRLGLLVLLLYVLLVLIFVFAAAFWHCPHAAGAACRAALFLCGVPRKHVSS